MQQPNHIIAYSIGYLLFFSLLLLASLQRRHRLFDEQGKVTDPGALLFLHMAGIILLGVFPAVFVSHDLIDIVFGKNPPGSLPVWLAGFFAILAMIIGTRAAEKKSRRVEGNERALVSFSSFFTTNYFSLRVVFLMVYEIWFRGYLLTDSIASWGIPAAILVNMLLYVLLHSVNGKDEMLGCIPFGILLCILCIWTGAAWPAMVVHVSLAVSYEARLVRKCNKRLISLI